MMSNVDVEVMDIRKSLGDGKVKAFADLKFARTLLVKGFSVMEGKNGVFVSMPKKPGKDGKWYETVLPSDSLRADIENLVMEAYDRETDGVNS